MNSIISQVSYPVFISGVFVFFIIASIFSFIVGIGLATRSATMLRFFNFMNKSFSTRRLMKPLAEPHIIEPTLLKHPAVLGVAVVAGAITSIVMLRGIEPGVFQPLYEGWVSKEAAGVLGGYTRWFLLVGNAVCVVVGIMLLFFPRVLSSIERYTDKWYTFRKQTRPLYEMHLEVDKWVLSHPTVSGITLSVLSLGLGVAMYVRI